MSEVEELEARIRQLPPESLAQFRDWFYQFKDDCWDRQIAADFKAGKFARLIDEAWQELALGQVREL